MIIDCISDLHGHYPEMPGGDLLIIAGDVTESNTFAAHLIFLIWLHNQKYRHYIFIAGNHDNILLERSLLSLPLSNTTYLFDSGTEFEGLKIWGSPWTQTFKDMNPYCRAFTVDAEEELEQKFNLIPDDIDILITHSPPYGIMDEVIEYGPFSHERKKSVGSKSLLVKCLEIRPKLHVYGHIHEAYGQDLWKNSIKNRDILFVNASHVNENYKPVNKPIRVIL